MDTIFIDREKVVIERLREVRNLARTAEKVAQLGYGQELLGAYEAAYKAADNVDSLAYEYEEDFYQGKPGHDKLTNELLVHLQLVVELYVQRIRELAIGAGVLPR